MFSVRSFCYGVSWGLLFAATALGQELPDGIILDGPPAPTAPAVVNRDSAGKVTIRATRLTQSLRIDGVLDEALYRDVEPVSELIQVEPRPGELATDRTEFWIAFDESNVYYSVRAWDGDVSKLLATEMRRDGGPIFNSNDVIAIILDTFYDRRNAFAFNVNPLAGRQDGQITNNRAYSSDFNPIWDVSTGRFSGGWTVEGAIPFKSLRYRPGRAQVWGFNLMRAHPAKNEIAFLVPMPPGRGRAGMTQISLAATVVGIEAPISSRTFDIKPYVTSSLTSDTTTRPRLSNDLTADVGVDAKFPLTQGLTLDATYNTDFAQVEADEQQVNLTRFSLFFPEKREFFLENSGVFTFGGLSAGAANAATSSNDVPILFYSRRIGLNNGQLVPLNAGARITGRVGQYTIGMADIQTGDEETSGTRSTNFSVVRLKRDILRRSSIGVIATGRTVGPDGRGDNVAFGVDGTFTFFTNVNINTYWAKTSTDGLRGDDTSYRAQFDYPADRWGIQAERTMIGDNFNPEVGFVRRDNMTRSFGQLRFSPRMNTARPIARRIRKLSYLASVAHIEDGAGRLETRERTAEFAIEFTNADRFSVAVNNNYEFLPVPFRIAPAVTLPVASYDFSNVEVGFNVGAQTRRSVSLLFEYGDFYSGDRTAFSASRGRLQLSNQLSLEPTYSINKVSFPQGSFTTHLGGSRITYTMTPLMFASALLQYNSSSNSVGVNARLRWEYRPGSELFVVYNEQRDTRIPSFPGLTNRTLILKINRLMRL